MTFRSRLVVIAAAAVAAAVALASVVVFFIAGSQLRGQVDDSLRELADSFGRVHMMHAPAPAPELQGPGTVLPRPHVLRVEPPSLGGPSGFAQIVTADGVVIRPPGSKGGLDTSEQARRVAARNAAPFFSEQKVGGAHLRVYTSRAGPGEAVQVARSLTEVNRSLSRLGLALLAVSLGGVGLAAGLGFLVARTALTPVRRLSRTAEEVARTRDLSQRIEIEGSDELGRLGVTFNAMLEALAESESARRQLVADASHELRTPLTSLRTNLELLARDNDLSAPERGRVLRRAVSQTQEFGVLVEDLVDLARGGEADLAAEDVRLDLLVAEAIERSRRHAPDRRFEVTLEPCLVRGAADRIDRAVSNLLDNALKWGPREQPVEVSVHGGQVTVRDHGPGIAAQDLPLVFDRFYRAPAARGLPGSGLGLAIVRQVAEAHGGHAMAESLPDGGTRLSVRLLPVS